jgi:DNA polymerase III alpha subunit
LLDSILNIEDMINFCINNKYNSIALTDHGNMFEFVNFYKACINSQKNIVQN